MKNLTLLTEHRHSVEGIDETEIVSLCLIPDGHDDEKTMLLCRDGTLISVSQEGNELSRIDLNVACEDEATGWFSLTFVDPELICLSQSGAIVSVLPETGATDLVGEFDHGLQASQWSPDGEVIALITQTKEDDTGTTNSALLTMNTQFEVLVEAQIEALNPSEAVSLTWRPDGTLLAVSSVDTIDYTRRVRIYKRETLDLSAIGRSEDGSGKLVPNLRAPLAWASSGCSNLLASVQRKGTKKQQVVFFEPNGLRHRDFLLRSSPEAIVVLLHWNVESDLLAVVLREDSHDEIQLFYRSNYHWYLKQSWRYQGKRVSFCQFHEEQGYRLYVGLTDGSWRQYDVCWVPSTLHVTDQQCIAAAVDGCSLNLTPLDKALVPPPMYAATVTMPAPIREVAFARDSSAPLSAVAWLSDMSFALLVRNEDKGEESGLIANYTVPGLRAVAFIDGPIGFDSSSLRQIQIMKAGTDEVELIGVSCGTENDHCDRLVVLSITEDVATVIDSIPLEGRVLRVVPWSDKPQGAVIELDDGTLLECSDGDVMPSEAEPLLEPCPWIAALHEPPLNEEGRSRIVVGLSSRSRLYCHDRLLSDTASSFLLSIAHKFLIFATLSTSCQLKFLPIEELANFDPLMGSDENHLLEGYEPRNVERGARLVAVLPNQPSTILQMPRGNMEGISPRAMVLPYVMDKISSGDYAEAFQIMRRQKVDLNLIVDMNPSKFVDGDGAEIFLEQVKPIDYLNLFISCLHEWDVTRDLYPIPSWYQHEQRPDSEMVDNNDKVNQVCRKLRSIMLEAERNGTTLGGRVAPEGHFLLPIFSTFAKESPPKLEDALSLIRECAVAKHVGRKPPLFSDKAQKSIHYLAFLADDELLFKTALGMYDFDLARAVARNSQMDPKVYLPLLKRLKGLPEYYGKYEVDVRLERYEAALSHLHKSGTTHGETLDEAISNEDAGPIFGNGFEQCLQLVEKHNLHRLGLQLFQNDSEKKHQIMLSLGENLLQTGSEDAALSVFLAAEPPYYVGAKRAARKCGDWRLFFSLSIESSPEDQDETEEIRNRRLANTVAEEIATGKSGSTKRTGLTDAATILLEYGNDVAGAVDMLISAERWSEARRVACLYDRHDLVKKTVDASGSYAHTLCLDFDERKTRFEETSKSYVTCLNTRKEGIREAGGEFADALDQADETGSLFSLASNASNASLRSNISSGSVSSVTSVSSIISVGNQSSFTMRSEHDTNRHKSKFNKIGRKKDKKRKKSKKQKRMRPGSQEELKSLVATLQSCIVDEEYADITSETILFLSQVGKLEAAREVYEAYQAMEKAVSSCQAKRIETHTLELAESVRKARMEGVEEPPVVLPCESEVDSLKPAMLNKVIDQLFSFL